MAHERLALVALASSMSPAEAGVTEERVRRLITEATTTVAPSTVAVDQLHAAVSAGSRSRAVPQNSESRVFGASFPGLVLVDVGSRLYLKYAEARDSVTNNVPQRIVADLGAATLLLCAATLGA